MPFKRAELIQLRAKAEKAANTPHLNPTWKRACIQLAQACDYLDAMIARTILYGPEEEPKLKVEAQ